MIAEFYKRGARPAMMWAGLVLVPVAVTHPGVGADKLVPLLTFLAAIYSVRGWEKVNGVRQDQPQERRQESVR